MNELIQMLRTILQDFGDKMVEVFTYSGNNVFYLTEENISAINEVTVNDSATTNYTFNSDVNSVTVNDSMNNGDVVKIFYTKNKFSDRELDAYIRQALLYIALGYKNFDVNDDGSLNPEPTSEEKKLIVLIASILAKPNYTEYRLPTVTVRYTENMSVEEKINALINRYVVFAGIWDYVEIQGLGSTGVDIP